VFNASIDILLAQLMQRFTGIDIGNIGCLTPTFLSAENTTDEALFEAAESLCNTYTDDPSDSSPCQLVSFRMLFEIEIKSVISVLDLATLLRIRNQSFV
jgi:hypothetical protein